MEEADIEQFRMNLRRLRSELQDLEKSAKDAAKPVQLDQASVGRLSRMDAMQAQQMAQETGRRRQQQVTKIDAALHRIESGDYGYCYVCGEEIDIRRLAVDPTITRCIKCVEK